MIEDEKIYIPVRRYADGWYFVLWVFNNEYEAKNAITKTSHSNWSDIKRHIISTNKF